MGEEASQWVWNSKSDSIDNEETIRRTNLWKALKDGTPHDEITELWA